MSRTYGGNYNEENAKRINEAGYSQIFEVIKTHPQRLDPSYTSAQLIGVLDFFLYSALTPIIEKTNFFDLYLNGLAAAYAANDTHRLSSLTRWEFATLTMVYQLAPIPMKMKGVTKLKINRLVLTVLIDFVMYWAGHYSDLLDKYYATGKFQYKNEANKIALFLGAREDIYGLKRECAYWLESYKDFYSQIAEKYYRLAINYVSFFSKRSTIPLDDLVQVAIETLVIALARYDVDKGPITTFLQTYLRSVDSRSVFYTPHIPFSSKSVAEMMRLRTMAKDKPSISYESLASPRSEREGAADNDTHHTESAGQELRTEAINPEQLPSFASQEVTRLQRLMEVVDPKGIGQFIMGITHIPDSEDEAE